MAVRVAVAASAAPGVPLRDLVGACAAGYLDSTPLLDLNYLEDAGGGPDVSVALMPHTGKIVLLQVGAMRCAAVRCGAVGGGEVEVQAG